MRQIFRRVILAELLGVSIVTYGVSIACGFCIFLQTFLVTLEVLGFDVSSPASWLLPLVQAFGYVVGTKGLWLYYNRKELRRHPKRTLMANGNSFYGGVGGMILGLVLAGRYLGRFPTIVLLDAMFLCLPIFQVFIRIGCFSYGCCFGHAYDGPLAIRFLDPYALAHRKCGDARLHATQLYSVAKDVLLFVFIVSAFRVMQIEGAGLALWLVGYGLLRFFVDFTRSVSKTIWFGLRSSQGISLVVFFSGIVMLNFFLGRRYTSVSTVSSAITETIGGIAVLPPIFLLFVLAFGVSFVKKLQAPV